MSRFFVTTNASRTYAAGGINFPFEPVSQRGGSWLGVLALDNETEASILLSAGFPQVAEITEERYQLEKKKLEPRQNSSPVLPTKPVPVAGVAGVAGQSSVRGVAKGVDPAKDPNSTALLTSVTLLGSRATPPHEPLLELPAQRRPRVKQ